MLQNIISRWLLTIFIAVQSITSYANAIQFFNNATFQNPAKMVQTKTNQLIVGDIVVNIYDAVSGKITGVDGKVTSDNTLSYLPYFLFSHRVSEKWVLGFDMSKPVLGYITWPAGAFQSNFGVDAIIEGHEFTPKLTYSLTEKLALGFSFRYLNVNRTVLNFDVFNTYEENIASGNAVGGALGFWYQWNEATFIDLAWFSPMNATVTGSSRSGNIVRNDYYISRFAFEPSTLVGNLTHIFSEKILANFQWAYSFWKVNNNIIMHNVAIGDDPSIFRLDWKNTSYVSLLGRYQWTDKLALMGILGFDQSLVGPTNNLVAFPIGDIYLFSLGVEYRFIDAAALQIFAGQGRVTRPDIHNPIGIADAANKARYSWVNANITVTF